MSLKILIFDWGDTVMKDFGLPGPMSEWESVELIPGAGEALSSLSEEFLCIIATSAPHSGRIDMMAALERVGADKYFDYYFSSKDLGVSKPDPDFFRLIIDNLGYYPWEAVSIGNIYEKDVASAKEVGMKTVFYNNNGEEGDYPSADAVILEMGMLPDAIAGLK